MSEAAGIEPNPYAAPGATSDPEAVAGRITLHELTSFAGLSGLHWWRLSRNGQRDGLWPSWNWPAAIFTLFWFAYRKLWREYLVIYASGVCVGLVRSVAAGLLGRAYLLGFWGDLAVDAALYGVLLGLFGNAIYLRRARLEIAEARRDFPEDGTGQTSRLTRRGGRSGWWMLAGIGAYYVAVRVEEQVRAVVLGWLF